MENITISVPEEIKRKIEQFPEINWSGLLRKFIESKVERLLWKEQMLKQLSAEGDFEEEALRIGDKIKQGAWERLKKEGW